MTRLSFALAQSEAEVDLAFELALSIFEPMSGLQGYRHHKILLWKKDPTYAVNNFILAWTPQGNVCGLIRIVPRVVFRGTEKFSVAGISSVCLAPDCRGQGNSVGLMKFTIDICKARDFDFAFLFARRVADNFYTQFGFHGISSYSRISVRSKKLPLDSRFSVEPACKAHIDWYASAYERCYASVFGRVERSRAYWKFLLDRCAPSSPEKIETIFFLGEPIGYLVAGASSVLELATSVRTDSDGLIAFLSHQFPSVVTEGTICFDMPPQHDFVCQLAGMDMTLSLRECSYGGHMARILDTDDTLSHAETCRALGAYAISVPESSSRRSLPYQMSILDHF
jgi:N-acetylglutamate synthase-like GNAT family acetyltransferase